MRSAQSPGRRAPGLSRSRRAPVLGAVAAFALLGATLAYWTLQWLAPAVAIAPAASLLDYARAPDLAAARALFGDESAGAAPGAAADIDVRVLGIASSGARGSAVLAVAARGAKAYVVGDRIDDRLQLVEIRDDAAVLERDGVRIELPAPQRPSIALLSGEPAAASPVVMPDSKADAPASIHRSAQPAEALLRSPRAPSGVDLSGMPAIRGSSTRSVAPAPRAGE